MKTAVLLGAGGLGCPAALALRDEARAQGIELRLVIVDPDRVDRSNLARQVLYTDADVGLFKAEAAARRLGAGADPRAIRIEPRVARFDSSTAASLLEGADLLIDGTDNFATRFCANDEAVARGLPLVHGAALGWIGQAVAIVPGLTGCLRCLFEGPPPEGAVPACAEAGVFAPLCGMVGAAMAQAAAQVLAEKKIFFSSSSFAEPGVLYRWDALRGTLRPLSVKRDPACAACGRAASTIGA